MPGRRLLLAGVAGIALVAVLGGAFRRHGGFLRPFLSILAVVGLVAMGLAIDSLAVRMSELIPLLWLRAILPAAICAVVLFGPGLRDRWGAVPRAMPHGADAG